MWVKLEKEKVIAVCKRQIEVQPFKKKLTLIIHDKLKNNFLLTKCEVITVEYWPEVVAVWTKCIAKSVQKQQGASVPQCGSSKQG